MEYSKLTGGEGGRAQKQNPWAVLAAKRLARETDNAPDDVAWLSIPLGQNCWELVAGKDDILVTEVYRDGQHIHFVDVDFKPAGRSLTKSTFLRNYYRAARKAGRNPP